MGDHQQGNPNRRANVLDTFLASYAVVKYVEFHGIGQKAENVKEGLSHLARYFTLKTGAHLILGMDEEESRMLQILEKAIKKVGREALIEIVKESAGL